MGGGVGVCQEQLCVGAGTLAFRVVAFSYHVYSTFAFQGWPCWGSFKETLVADEMWEPKVYSRLVSQTASFASSVKKVGRRTCSLRGRVFGTP